MSRVPCERWSVLDLEKMVSSFLLNVVADIDFVIPKSFNYDNLKGFLLNRILLWLIFTVVVQPR